MTIETKYNDGDILFYLDNSQVKSQKPIGFKVDCTYHGYSGKWGESPAFPIIVSYLMEKSGVYEKWILESKLFPSKEELLKSL